VTGGKPQDQTDRGPGGPASRREARLRPGDVPRRELLGVPIALIDYAGAIEVMDGMIERRERGYVCAAAVHAVMVSRHDAEMRAALLGATLTVPDGRPLVWALNMLGERMSDRVYGPELMARYCRRLADRGGRVSLYGGSSQGALDALVDALEKRHPAIQIVGDHSPPHRPLTPAEDREIAARINADRPDVVWVGIGAPRQEKWMARMRPLLDAPVLVGVGAAFDFLAGLKRQAPRWMQDRGLEWAYRLSQEPLRLLPRYLRYNPAFIAAFTRQYARERRR
jgi:N-acetylglucosaminyldiphosphoundecaprenol N-acetyl-beta-D-mannosaminyltransferase